MRGPFLPLVASPPSKPLPPRQQRQPRQHHQQQQGAWPLLPQLLAGLALWTIVTVGLVEVHMNRSSSSSSRVAPGGRPALAVSGTAEKFGNGDENGNNNDDDDYSTVVDDDDKLRQMQKAAAVARRNGGGGGGDGELPGRSLNDHHLEIHNSNSNNIIKGGTGNEKSSPYAYVFMLAGCDPDHPSKYHHFLYSIYVCVFLLRRTHRSTADIVVYYGMHADSSRDDLPRPELDALRSLGGPNADGSGGGGGQLRLIKLPKSQSRTFYNIQLSKFRVLGLTEYRRVLFLDADVLPLKDMDFLFELSDPAPATNNGDPSHAHLQENVALRAHLAPINGGFFLLAPREGDLEAVNQMIQDKERAVAAGKPFDPVKGWGRRLASWDGLSKSGSDWTFWGASGDQVRFPVFGNGCCLILHCDNANLWLNF